MNDSALHLFEGFGIELEYMLVKRDTLDVFPAADRLLQSVTGGCEAEIERGALCWSNELVLHVIELKTNGPAQTLNGLSGIFQSNIQDINRRMEPLNGFLMPTAMHPWMNPGSDTRLWPHEHNAVYETYHRIFNCRGHGWSNLQSAHINLPFADDDEFGRLHAAIRLLLPLLPAISASSPLADHQSAGFLDTRLEYYRTNSMRIPMVCGQVIPEPVYTHEEYHTRILQAMYTDIAPYDPDGILQHEWLNARGAIARFDRNTIEIRVLDIQECPEADLAVAYAVISVLRDLIEERWCSFERQKNFSTDALASIFRESIRNAENTWIQDRDFLELFGISKSACTAGELWTSLLESHLSRETEFQKPLQTILDEGSLSNRILQRLQNNMSPDSVRGLYLELCGCLHEGRMFHV